MGWWGPRDGPGFTGVVAPSALSAQDGPVASRCVRSTCLPLPSLNFQSHSWDGAAGGAMQSRAPLPKRVHCWHPEPPHHPAGVHPSPRHQQRTLWHSGLRACTPLGRWDLDQATCLGPKPPRGVRGSGGGGRAGVSWAWLPSPPFFSPVPLARLEEAALLSSGTTLVGGPGRRPRGGQSPGPHSPAPHDPPASHAEGLEHQRGREARLRQQSRLLLVPQ